MTRARPGSGIPLRRRLLALLALPALVLAGCVSVPFSSEIEAGGPVNSGVEADFDFLPSGPSDGATQEEILAGFFGATTASQDNYRIARSYLADDVAETWNPYASTLVRSRDGLVEREDDTTLTYSVPITASVDNVGRYSESDSPASQDLPPFRFALVDGDRELTWSEVDDALNRCANLHQSLQIDRQLLLGALVECIN